MENERRKNLSGHLRNVWAATGILLVMLGMLLGQIVAQFSLAVDQPASLPVVYARQLENDETPPSYQLSAHPKEEPQQQEQTGPPDIQTLLANVPKANSAPRLVVPNYMEDRSIREALLARPEQWQVESSTNTLSYFASNHLHIYLGNPYEPLPASDVQTLLSTRRDHTVLTARILLGLWYSRRDDARYTSGNSVAVRVDEILAWRGVQKHQRVAYPGAKKRFSDGYQWKHRQQVYADLRLLQSLFVGGQRTIVAQGKALHVPVNSLYLHLVLSEEAAGCTATITGCLVSPGGWFYDYEAHHNRFFAPVDRRIFQLNPQNDQIALRVALYLTEHWRLQARRGLASEPTVMSDLLAASMVPIDRANLTSRFAPRVEAALLKLHQQGILGMVPLCLSPIDKTQAQWSKDWLAARWLIVPPQTNSHLSQSIRSASE